MDSYVEPKLNIATQIAKCIGSGHIWLIVWTSSYTTNIKKRRNFTILKPFKLQIIKKYEASSKHLQPKLT